MAEREVLVKVFTGRYQQATKKERRVILSEFVLANSYKRRSAHPALPVRALGVRGGLKAGGRGGRPASASMRPCPPRQVLASTTTRHKHRLRDCWLARR